MTTTIESNDMPYIRVGCDYFRKTLGVTDTYGIQHHELRKWKKEEIKEDNKNDGGYIAKIPKYYGFTMLPDNTDSYRQEVDNHYNDYERCAFTPVEGPWIKTERFIRHIFGTDYDMGIKYLSALYRNPDKPSVILALVSVERQTGKSAFLNWINIIYGKNATIIQPAQFTKNFNSTYGNCNIICVDEVRAFDKNAVDNLKYLSTATSIWVDTKGIMEYKLPFFGKFILTSNHEDTFAKVDEEEIRFFIRKVGPIPKDEYEDNFLQVLTDEIPAFLFYLNTVTPMDYTLNRTGFDTIELDTESLRKVKRESRPQVVKDLEEYIKGYFDGHLDLNEVRATPKEIEDTFFRNNKDAKAHYIGIILKRYFGLEPVKDSMRYVPYWSNFSYTTGNIPSSTTGRYYTFTRDQFCNDGKSTSTLTNIKDMYTMIDTTEIKEKPPHDNYVAEACNKLNEKVRLAKEDSDRRQRSADLKAQQEAIKGGFDYKPKDSEVCPF